MYRFQQRRRLTLVALVLTALFLVSACGGSQQPAQTAAPEKQAAPAAPAAPVAVAAPSFDRLIVLDSVVRGSANLTDEEKKAGKSCQPNAKFLKNEQVVWRIKVVDPKTGAELDDKSLSKVQVKLADGQTFDAKFGIRPKDKPTDGFWTTSFTVPEDYPVGTLNYAVEATANDGRGSQFVTFKLASSAMTILPDVRPKLEKKS